MVGICTLSRPEPRDGGIARNQPLSIVPRCRIFSRMIMQQASPSPGCRTYVVGCDVRQDIRVFSGTTYHLAQQGVEDGLLTGMMNLHPRGIGDWRVYAKAGLWKLRGGFRGRHGFIFTDGYLESIWKRALPALQGSTVINN